MNVETHWEKIYRQKAPDAVSWYRPHLETSLALIEKAAPERGVSIIDVGGGESTLVDDLLAHGYQNITVLDVSKNCHRRNQKSVWVLPQKKFSGSRRTSSTANSRPTPTMCGTTAPCFISLRRWTSVLPTFAKWRAVKPGGHVLVSTFGPEGPTKCSGLEVARYDAESLHAA